MLRASHARDILVRKRAQELRVAVVVDGVGCVDKMVPSSFSVAMNVSLNGRLSREDFRCYGVTDTDDAGGAGGSSGGPGMTCTLAIAEPTLPRESTCV